MIKSYRGGNARDRRRMRREILRRSPFLWHAVKFVQFGDDVDAMNPATFMRLMSAQ